MKDLDEEPDVLEDLEEMFDDLSHEGPTNEQLYKMYGVFLTDFEKNPVYIKGVQLEFNRDKSKHPICKGKVVAFEHIITRESKYKGKRYFDKERANKIHWIRPIIENVNDKRIKYFERINDDSLNQQFYWYHDKNFIVIIRELNPKLFLITSFAVDTNEKQKFRDWYNEYNKKTSLRK